MRSRSVRPQHKLVQLVEVRLHQITRPRGILVLHLHRDHARFLVFCNRGAMRQALGRIHTVAFVVQMLQLKAVDQVATHRPAVQQVDKECRSAMAAKKTAGETAQSPQGAGARGERRQHHGSRALLIWRHNAGEGFVLLGNDERQAEAQGKRNQHDARQQAAMPPKQRRANRPVLRPRELFLFLPRERLRLERLNH